MSTCAAAPTAAQPQAASSAAPQAAAAADIFAAIDADARRALSMQHFFIVGCQKTGTTWLQAALNGHPEIACRGEARFATLLLPHIAAAVRGHNKAQRAGELGAITGEQMVQLFRVATAMVMSRWPMGPRVRIIGEKTPEHAIFMGALSNAFPKCRFIHIIRDGRDAAASGWRHNLRENNPEFHARFPTFAPYAAHFAAEHYVTYINRAREWGRAHTDRYREVRYEDLHADPETSMRSLLEFLGADASERPLRRCIDAGAFERLSGGRARGETDNNSHFRKGIVGDWLEHFDDAALAGFNAAAGPLMRELGYA